MRFRKKSPVVARSVIACLAFARADPRQRLQRGAGGSACVLPQAIHFFFRASAAIGDTARSSRIVASAVSVSSSNALLVPERIAVVQDARQHRHDARRP